MSTKLYVGNLGSETTTEQLQEMFARFGKVGSVRIVEDGDSGKSKGFGFVEMLDTSAAEAAIRGLNGKEHGGRAIIVNRPGPGLSNNTGGTSRRGRSR